MVDVGIYQKGESLGFISFHVRGQITIDQGYADGVSITYDSSHHQHIWTYAAGRYNDNHTDSQNNCPCTVGGGSAAPPFV